MNNLESLTLFKNLNEVSMRYKTLELNNNQKDLEDNQKLNSLIQFYKSNINQIKERAHFISKQTKDEAINSSKKDIYNTLIELNNFSRSKYNFLINSNMDVESTTAKAVMLTTIDELVLINESIKNKEYLKDRNTYFYLYEKITINAFMTFLALKDMSIEKAKIDNLSQGILSQIQTLSLISI